MAVFDVDTTIVNIMKALDCSETIAKRIASLTENVLEFKADMKDSDDEKFTTLFYKAYARLEGYMIGVRDARGFGTSSYFHYSLWFEYVEDPDYDAYRMKDWLNDIVTREGK